MLHNITVINCSYIKSLSYHSNCLLKCFLIFFDNWLYLSQQSPPGHCDISSTRSAISGDMRVHFIGAFMIIFRRRLTFLCSRDCIRVAIHRIFFSNKTGVCRILSFCGYRQSSGTANSFCVVCLNIERKDIIAWRSFQLQEKPSTSVHFWLSRHSNG